MERKKVVIVVVIVAVLIAASLYGVILLSGQTEGNKYGDMVKSTNLKIMGNANEDHIVDDNDIKYIEKVINGEEEETELTDANNDGVINQADIDQVRAIINHESSFIYFIDLDGQTRPVHYPINTIVATYNIYVEMIVVLGETGKIIGVDDTISKYDNYFPTLQGLPSVGNRFTPDVEKILGLNPDLYFTGTRGYYDSGLEAKLAANGTSVEVVRLPSWEYGLLPQGILTLGYILKQESRAYEFLEWYQGIQDDINEKLDALDDSEKVTALGLVGTSVQVEGGGKYEMMVNAGCINLASDLTGTSSAKVDVEWVLEKDPDVILTWVVAGFWEGTSDATLQTQLDSMKDLYSATRAVQNGRIYVMAHDITCGPAGIISVAYYAKWFYPELFEDLDPEALHQEFVDRFMGVDVEVSEGAFVL